MAAMIDYVMQPFRRLHISTTEFATLQAIMFFDPGKLIIDLPVHFVADLCKDLLLPVDR